MSEKKLLGDVPQNNQSPDLQMQAGASWIIYGMANNHAMKCLMLRAEVLLAS
jgi:hypothetical protein